MKSWFLLLIFVGGLSPSVHAQDISYEGPADWSAFDKFMETKEKEDQVSGLSYMLAGTIATLGGVVGYYSSEDSFSRGLYAVSQSLGVAAIGYGASNYFIGNEFNSFYRAVEGSKLNNQQKTDLLRRFLEIEKKQQERRKLIKVVTHSLIAAVNFYSAHREEDKNVKGVLNFLGIINAAMALTYTF